MLTPGQRGDVPLAAALIEGLGAEAVIADTAYDAGHFRRRLAEIGAKAVIPPNPSRSLKPEYDAELYKERNLIERFFGRLKLNRRLATRYEKTARNYFGFVFWASTLVLLR